MRRRRSIAKSANVHKSKSTDKKGNGNRYTRPRLHPTAASVLENASRVCSMMISVVYDDRSTLRAVDLTAHTMAAESPGSTSVPNTDHRVRAVSRPSTSLYTVEPSMNGYMYSSQKYLKVGYASISSAKQDKLQSLCSIYSRYMKA